MMLTFIPMNWSVSAQFILDFIIDQYTSRKAIEKSFAWPKCYFWRIILIHKQCGISRKVCEIQAGKSSLWYLTLILHFSGRPRGRGPGGYWLVHLSLDWVTWLSCCIFERNTLLSGIFLHPRVLMGTGELPEKPDEILRVTSQWTGISSWEK